MLTLLDKLTEIEHYCEGSKRKFEASQGAQEMSPRARVICEMILEVVKEVREMVTEGE